MVSGSRTTRHKDTSIWITTRSHKISPAAIWNPSDRDRSSEEGEDFILSTHEGEEFIYVLNGVVEINYGKNTYILEEGDSIYYDSIVAHHVHAAADNKARILGVVYTPY